MTDLRLLKNGPLQSLHSRLASDLLSARKQEKLERRRWRRKSAERRLARDRAALPQLLEVCAEIERRRNRPIDNIEAASDAELQALRARYSPRILSNREVHRALLSSLGSFDGDRALDAHEQARAIVNQIDRELSSRGRAAA